jgi:hypothetical protein
MYTSNPDISIKNIENKTVNWYIPLNFKLYSKSHLPASTINCKVSVNKESVLKKIIELHYRKETVFAFLAVSKYQAK